MRRLRNILLFASSVLLLGSQVWAQDPYYRNRYPQQTPYGYGGSSDYLINRVLSDLNSAARRAYLDRHEMKHFEEAAANLQAFQDRWRRGRFDNGRLDHAIDNLKHLADADRVNGRDRQMFARDIQDLREFRATRGGYSNYGSWR